MEREELLQQLDGIVPKKPKSEWSKYQRKIVDEVIKALEQEPILNKIKTEIENTMKYQYAVGENQYAEGFEKSLEIINKYIAESER